MAGLQLHGLTKRYGDFHATQNVELEVKEGEFLVLLGPSGCGKTTTLRMIAGFVDPTEGSIRIGGKDVTTLPPWKRNTGLVFQNYALFPHMTVAQNVAFGLEMRGVAKREIAPRVQDALELVQLGHLADRYPRQMSGGQQQRVALARALVFRPDVLLLDEPLSNLDAKLRHEVRIEIRALQQRLGITAVMVTHDQEEALTMADRLVVMSDGQVRQVGSQRDLYERPASRFVAGFVGRSSFLEGEIRDGRFTTPGGLTLPCDKPLRGPAVIALRPERMTVAAQPHPGSVPGEVEFVSYMGGLIDLHLRLSPTDLVVAQVSNREGSLIPELGDTVHVSWPDATAFPASDPHARGH
ncbi:ABC transporter ATP-binding protein [Salipiger pacificus]|nr:ABC transporter ATP-binding protein [Alloyangia pacifica]MCA0946208.1 ABC transporter ATP-binding protein [Alloyangia pacifica]